MAVDESERLLVAQIREGDAQAWEECIRRYEGRLLAFVESRLGNRATAEDVVQETFLGFLTSLPNYDDRTPLESFLFSIAAHKLTDVLRREGRRPTIPLFLSDADGRAREPQGRARVASSLMRSHEGRSAEERVIGECLQSLIQSWMERGEFERLCCIELLFVLGWSNKVTAERLGITEQAVANHKYFVVSKLKDAVARARLRNVDFRSYGLS